LDETILLPFHLPAAPKDNSHEVKRRGKRESPRQPFIPQSAQNPKARRTNPEKRFVHRILSMVIFFLNRLTMRLRTTHQTDDPIKTPATRNPAADVPEESLVIPRLANKARKNRMVGGLARVRRKVDAYSVPRLPP